MWMYVKLINTEVLRAIRFFHIEIRLTSQSGASWKDKIGEILQMFFDGFLSGWRLHLCYIQTLKEINNITTLHDIYLNWFISCEILASLRVPCSYSGDLPITTVFAGSSRIKLLNLDITGSNDLSQISLFSFLILTLTSLTVWYPFLYWSEVTFPKALDDSHIASYCFLNHLKEVSPGLLSPH